VREGGGDDPVLWLVPAQHCPFAPGRVVCVEQVVVGALPVPDLPAGVPELLYPMDEDAERFFRTR
jgi:hypothetical protein